MSANITKGLTFVSGGTYTAGHFNLYHSAATIADIDRTSANYTLGAVITRSATPPPGPTVKEPFIDTTPSSIAHEPIMTYTGGLFVESDHASYLFRFNSGNGAAVESNVLHGSIAAGQVRAEAGVSAHVTAATVGVALGTAETFSGTQYVQAKMFGLVQVKVISVVDVGNYLSQSPSTNGVLRSSSANNAERDDGSFSPSCAFQAMEASADSGVKTIWAKVVR